MKKIVVDLDVVTVHIWDKGARAEEASEFIEQVKGKRFEVIVPYALIELAEKWQYIELKKRIMAFYKENAAVISAEEVNKKLESFGVNDKEFAITLVGHGVKEEDAALVMVASLFESEYLVTFNRKHLRNKESEICEALRTFNLPKIKIRAPAELLKEVQR